LNLYAQKEIKENNHHAEKKKSALLFTEYRAGFNLHWLFFCFNNLLKRKT
jgi:hypothetical protein